MTTRICGQWIRSGAVLVGLLLCAAAAAAGDEFELGKGLYMKYCSACHGADGKGEGVVSQFLRPKPSDLTQLAKQEDGRFPFYKVIQIIDGRETKRAHGNPDMPVWGEMFTAQEGADPDRRMIVRGKVMLIADYLETIQEK